jgi:uncharacterized protein involved in outer membrane biogenesis
VLTLVLLLMLPVILNNIDLNQFKKIIETSVSEHTGRQLRIDGDLQFTLSLQPFLSIEKVSFSNAPWSKQEQMLTFEMLQLQIQLLPLLEKQLVIDQLLIKGLALVAEKNIDGQANWHLQNLDKDESTAEVSGTESTSFTLPFMPVVKQLQFDDINIYYNDIYADITTSINLEALRLSNVAINEPFNFHANGTINQQLFKFVGETNFQAAKTTFGSKQTSSNNALTVKLEADAIGVTLSANGVVKQVVDYIDVDINISLTAPDLDKTFLAATGKSLKQYTINTKHPLPLRFSANLTNRNGDYHLQTIRLKLADNDLNGNLSFNNHSKRPAIQATLHSENININRLLAKTSSQPINDKTDSADKEKLFELPDTPLPFKLFERLDASINYSANKILLDEFEAQALKLNLVLKAGKLQIKQFDFDLDGASVRSRMSANSQAKIPAVSTVIDIKNLNLEPIAKRFELSSLQQGILHGDIDVKGRGNNLKSLLLSLQGKSHIQLEQVKTSLEIENNPYDFYINKFEMRFSEMNAPLKYDINGSVNKETISLAGELATLTSLLNNSATSLSFKATALEAGLTIDSIINNPLSIDAAQINMALTMLEPEKSFKRVTRLIHEVKSDKFIPNLPVNLNAQLTISADRFNAKNIKLTVGLNDLSGEVTVNASNKKPVITALLSSQLLDIDSLQPPGKKTINENEREAQLETQQENTLTDNKLFSTEPLPALDALNYLDATIHYKLKNLTANNQNIQNISLALSLDSGELQLKPLTMNLADGAIKAELILSQNEQLHFQTNIEIKKLDYDRLLAMTGTEEFAKGELDAEIQLQGMGNSVSELMAGLNGRVRITTEDGRLYEPALRLLSKDIWSLIPFTDKSGRQEIRCAVMQFNINNGIAETHALVIDTGTVSALASGNINLATETLSLYVSPRSKRTSVMKLVLVPLNVEGSFTSPSITPDAAGTTFSAAKTTAQISLAIATGGISLLAEDATNKLWEQFIDDTDYCALALAGEKVVPVLIKLKDAGEDVDENEKDADYIEELDDDGGFY